MKPCLRITDDFLESQIAQFLELVKIDAPSKEESTFTKVVFEKLKKLGFQSKIDTIGNIYAFKEGKGTPLLLTAHLDRVEPGRGILPLVDEGVIKSDGTTILGADDVAGICEILGAIEFCQQQEISHHPMEIVFTVQEEIGGYGAKQFDFSKIISKHGISMDKSGPVGGVTMKEPFKMNFWIECYGRAAHAALEPEKGINAMMMAFDFMKHFQTKTFSEKTVFNIGLIQGGSATNVVPGYVKLVGEIRSFVFDFLDKEASTIREVARSIEKKHGGYILIEVDVLRGGYHYKSDTFLKKIEESCKNLGVPFSTGVSMGNSDTGFFQQHGILVYNCGCGSRNPHSKKECLPIVEFRKGIEFVVEMIRVK